MNIDLHTQIYDSWQVNFALAIGPNDNSFSVYVTNPAIFGRHESWNPGFRVLCWRLYLDAYVDVGVSY